MDKPLMTNDFRSARDRLINAMVDISMEAKKHGLPAALLTMIATREFNLKLVEVGQLLFRSCENDGHGVLLPDGRCVLCTPGLEEEEFERVKSLAERHRAGLDS